MTTRMATADQHQDQVRCRPGQRHQVFIANDLAEVARDHRRGLGPAHQHAAKQAQPEERSEDHQRGKEQCPDRIHVIHRVQRDAPFQAGRLVTQPRGHPRVRALVKAQREEEQHKLENGNDEACRLQSKTPGGRKPQVSTRQRRLKPGQTGTRPPPGPQPRFGRPAQWRGCRCAHLRR